MKNWVQRPNTKTKDAPSALITWEIIQRSPVPGTREGDQYAFSVLSHWGPLTRQALPYTVFFHKSGFGGRLPGFKPQLNHLTNCVMWMGCLTPLNEH